MRLPGSLGQLYQPSLMFRHLGEPGVKMKRFARFLTGLTNHVWAATADFAGRLHGKAAALSSPT